MCGLSNRKPTSNVPILANIYYIPSNPKYLGIGIPEAPVGLHGTEDLKSWLPKEKKEGEKSLEWCPGLQVSCTGALSVRGLWQGPPAGPNYPNPTTTSLDCRYSLSHYYCTLFIPC